MGEPNYPIRRNPFVGSLRIGQYPFTLSPFGPRCGGRRLPRPARVTHADPFEALGDPQRRAILALLGDGPHAVGQLADALPISRPAVSFHLRLLKEAGLVEEERSGTRRIYRLREAGLDAVARYLEQVWGEAAARFRLMAENTTHDR